MTHLEQAIADLRLRIEDCERYDNELRTTHDELHQRVEELRGLRVAVYPDQRIGAHLCWSGELRDWLTLEPFVCSGCYQMVSPSFCSAVLTYTPVKRNPQLHPFGDPERRHP